MGVNYSTPVDFLDARHNRMQGRTLMVGSGCYDGVKGDRRELYADVVGIDMQENECVDVVHDCELPLPESLGKFDHIDIASVLEHVQRPWLLAENIQEVMKPKASIFIQVPFVWRIHNYPGDYWRFTTQAMDILFPKIKWKERGYLTENSYKKLSPNTEIDGIRYMQRSEMLAYGILNL